MRELKGGDKAMEKIEQEREEIKAFLEAIRTENKAMVKQLASIIVIVGKMRTRKLGIDVMISDLEKKIK